MLKNSVRRCAERPERGLTVDEMGAVVSMVPPRTTSFMPSMSEELP